MNTIKKLTTTIILITTTIGTVYSNPCYTNIKDGCADNNQQVIHVKTNNTDFGFCTEFTDDQKKKDIYCYATLSEEEQAIADARRTNNSIPTSEPVRALNYTVVGGSNRINNGGYYDYGYNYSYDYGYDYTYNNGYYNGHRPHRPPHQGNRQPQNSQPVTLPSASFDRRNQGQQAPQQNIDRPHNNHGSGSYSRGGGSSRSNSLPSAKF